MSANLSSKWGGGGGHTHDTLFIPASRKQKQADFYEFEDKVVFIESSKPVMATHMRL